MKRAQVPPLAGLGILLAGIKSVAAGFEFSDHDAQTLERAARRDQIIGMGR
jgi:hypothetical protein